ncbi:MAG: hypothetical protein LUE31_03065 [Lachnospiraceae bacterium]|nr:hypothetical protein [Lachnospiraceae bacterium]
MGYLEIYKKYVTEDEFKRSTYFAAVEAGEMREEDAYLRLLSQKEWMYGNQIERGRKSETDAKIATWRSIDLLGEEHIVKRQRNYYIECEYDNKISTLIDKGVKAGIRKKRIMYGTAIVLVGIPATISLCLGMFLAGGMAVAGTILAFWMICIALPVETYYKWKMTKIRREQDIIRKKKFELLYH